MCLTNSRVSTNWCNNIQKTIVEKFSSFAIVHVYNIRLHTNYEMLILVLHLALCYCPTYLRSSSKPEGEVPALSFCVRQEAEEGSAPPSSPQSAEQRGNGSSRDPRVFLRKVWAVWDKGCCAAAGREVARGSWNL